MYSGNGSEYAPEWLSSLASGAFLFMYFVVLVIIVAAWWKIFTKAGQPGWFSLIPILNIYTMLQIVQRPAWWLLLYLVPIVNVVISIIVTVDTARVFGKGVGFALGLMFLPYIFYVILGFGDARYQPGNLSGYAPPAPPAPPVAPAG
ncbi:MAG: DUF5684 domain-containing protein [Coriobacteriia bacterium]|jgi:hypothetical protein|nr:DUF5684 domain-containing protein [Coriobacteriia bacterium]